MKSAVGHRTNNCGDSGWASGVFSIEVDTGSRHDNAIEQRSRTLLLILVVIRFVNRLFSTLPPFPATMSPRERFIAHWSEILMYTLLFLQPLVGWGMLSAARYPIVLWGGLHLFPTLPHSVMLYAALREVHTVLAYLLFLAIVAHFGAVLFHTWIVWDRFFSRIAPWKVRAR
ncbi:MAG TPA: cytochrome b/b6 domain-containing protein [Methylocella sp.]|nr:cytochrome b/b6 domain-containing protein [Methylocella sp.]